MPGAGTRSILLKENGVTSENEDLRVRDEKFKVALQVALAVQDVMRVRSELTMAGQMQVNTLCRQQS